MNVNDLASLTIGPRCRQISSNKLNKLCRLNVHGMRSQNTYNFQHATLSVHTTFLFGSAKARPLAMTSSSSGSTYTPSTHADR